MKNTVKLICLLLSIAVGTNLSASEYLKNVDPFDEISLSGNINVYLEQGNDENVEISEKDHKISVEVINGVLKVKRKSPLKVKEYQGPAIDVRVTYRKLRRIRSAAGATVSNSKPLKGDQLSLDFNSGSDGRILVDVDDLHVSVSEGAQLKIKGKTISQNTKVSTGAGLSAYRLECDRTYVKATTGGAAKVVANDLLEAKATTGGDIDYEGDPRKVKIKDTLGGNVSGG